MLNYEEIWGTYSWYFDGEKINPSQVFGVNLKWPDGKVYPHYATVINRCTDISDGKICGGVNSDVIVVLEEYRGHVMTIPLDRIISKRPRWNEFEIVSVELGE